jgi:type I restriction enzyme S subunit
MKFELFFEKFELFAEMPEAVPRMRELILDLAAQGLLTERNANDGRASDIVEAIANDRARLTSKKAIRRQAELPELSLDELPFVVPHTWTWVRLGNCVAAYTDDFVDGPFGSNLKADEYTEQGVPIARLKNIGRNQFKTKDIKFVSQKKAEELRRHSFKPGDLLLNKLGDPVGKCCIAPDELGDGIIVADVIRLRLSNKLFVPRLVSLMINAPTITRQLLSKITGITRDRVSLEKLRNLAIPLAPLAEQKRILAKVDALTAMCDRLEAQQLIRQARHRDLARASLSRFVDAPTPANLDFLFHDAYEITPADLRKSILTLAVQGKLVPQDPNDGDARRMIDRAMERRQKTIKSRNLRRKDLDESADLLEHKDLPSSWCVERLANLVDPENTISYGVLVPGNDVPDGIPFVRAQDLSLSNHPTRPNKTIAPDIERPYARTRLTGGEILLCVVGSIGKLGIVPDTWAGANIARAVARIKPIPEILRDYLLLVLQEQSVQSYFTSTTRTLAQPTLNVGMIEQTPIPVPPLAEQRRIVAKVDQLMTLVDQLENQLASTRDISRQLLDALVTELTEPSPN